MLCMPDLLIALARAMLNSLPGGVCRYFNPEIATSYAGWKRLGWHTIGTLRTRNNQIDPTMWLSVSCPVTPISRPEFKSLDFQQVFNTNDIKTQILTEDLQNLLQTHALERVAVIRDKRAPWISREIEQAIATRDKLYSRNPNRRRADPLWTIIVYATEPTHSFFSVKKRYADRNFSINLPAKTLWSNLQWNTQ